MQQKSQAGWTEKKDGIGNCHARPALAGFKREFQKPTSSRIPLHAAKGSRTRPIRQGSCESCRKKEMKEEQESGLAFEEPGNTTLTAQDPYFISVRPNLIT
jgi:hypothetical protein